MYISSSSSLSLLISLSLSLSLWHFQDQCLCFLLSTLLFLPFPLDGWLAGYDYLGTVGGSFLPVPLWYMYAEVFLCGRKIARDLHSTIYTTRTKVLSPTELPHVRSVIAQPLKKNRLQDKPGRRDEDA